MIYISADAALLRYAQKNNYKVVVEVLDTNSVYDHKQVEGIFDSLLLGPNYDSKELRDKNWHTISLNSYFYGYPPKTGKVIFPFWNEQEDEGNPEDEVYTNSDDIQDKSHKGKKGKSKGFIGLSCDQIIAIISILVILLLLLFLRK